MSREQREQERRRAEQLLSTVIDERYRIERLIGIGGMGAVYGARHLLLGHSVAVKVMLASAHEDEESRARFLKEARILASLKSPHIARVLDAGFLDADRVYFVMELLDGEDLDKRLRARQLTENEIVDVGIQICLGLAEAHRCGIIHRDLKPSNIFFADDGGGREVVKILDFGVAKRTSSEGDPQLTGSLKILGSPNYMSPEQIADPRSVDARSDLWSLGVMLYYALRAELPFRDPSLTALLLKIVNTPVTPLPASVGASLRATIARALSKDPASRPASADEFRAELERRSTEPSPHAGDSTGDSINVDIDIRPKKRRSGRRWVIGGAAAVALFTGVIVGQRMFHSAPVEGPPTPSASAPPSEVTRAAAIALPPATNHAEEAPRPLSSTVTTSVPSSSAPRLSIPRPPPRKDILAP